jgi:hypothetical protein
MRRACALLVTLAGCPETRPAAQGGTPLESPTPPAPVADAKESAPPAPSRSAITREGGRTTIATSTTVEEILLVPQGIVWTEDGAVRAALGSDESPQTLATLVDPHGLATGNGDVFWLGDEQNGRWQLATATAGTLPVVAGPGEQERLAFSDALFARTRTGALWRFDGLSSGGSIAPKRLDFHPDPALRVQPGFAAARGMLYVPALERRKTSMQFVLLRFELGGKTTKIPVDAPLRAFTWAVDRGGDVVLVDAERGAVVRIGAREKRATPMFERSELAKLCWCGADVCTFGVDGTVVRHSTGAREARAVAEGAREATAIACTSDRVAWVGAVGITMQSI